MRQRNDTGYEQHVSAWPTEEYPDLRPFSVGAGEEIDFPFPIGGFTPVQEEEQPRSRRKDATVVADMKEGEPQ